jgi:hypothetical protein
MLYFVCLLRMLQVQVTWNPQALAQSLVLETAVSRNRFSMSRRDLPLEDKTVTFEEVSGIGSRSELRDVTNGHLTQIVLHGLAIKLAKVSTLVTSFTGV